MDRAQFGKPTVGFGFSNGAKARMRDSPFRKAAFEVGAGETVELTVTLEY